MPQTKNHASVKQMSLSTAPSSRNSLILDDVLLLDDNIFNDIKAPVDENGYLRFGKKYPYKQMYSLSITCLSGTIYTSLNLQEFEMKENDSLVCFAGAIIDNFKCTPNCKFYIIALSEDEFFNNNPAACMRSIRQNMVHPILIHNTKKETDTSFSLYKVLREIIMAPAFDFRMDAAKGTITCMASGLAQWLIMQNEQQKGKNVNQYEALFTDFLQAVHKYCYKERKITFYAKLFDISPKYFSKLIYDVSGKHAGAWIREHVTLEAKAMLNSGNKSVLDVSNALNFPNASFFGKYFKANTGMSPKQYALKSSRG